MDKWKDSCAFGPFVFIARTPRGGFLPPGPPLSVDLSILLVHFTSDTSNMEEEHLNLGKSTAALAILLLEKAFFYLGGRSGYSEEGKAKLSQNLHTIHREFGDKPLPRSLGRQVREFRLYVENVEDAIDDIEYEVLSHRFEEEVRQPISKFVKTKIVKKVARFFVPNRNLGQLRTAVMFLEHITLRMKRHISSDFSDAYQQRNLLRATGDVFGRDKEKEQIVHWLTQVACTSPISCFAIVGMAGMGKTALAQLVCQDSRVLVNFDYVVWVPQAVDLGAEAVTTDILGSIGLPVPSRIESMQYHLAEELRGNKILLILDDVWEDESTEKWANLASPLRSAMRGSKILLTTRMQSVADMAADVVGGEAESLTLDELDEHSNFLLFKSQLTPHINFEDHADLLLIGEQIARKFGGCPILTLAITSLLKYNLLASYWHTVLHTDMHKITGIRGILQVFQSSYDRLPTQLQVCFRYCAIFPTGYRFNKEELVNMWVRSGLIPFASLKPGDIGLPFASPKPGDFSFLQTEIVTLLNPEDVGQQCFTALTRKSFFCRVLERDPSNGDQKEYYVLHSIMRYFAEFVSPSECARIHNGCFRGSSLESGRSYRKLDIQHLSIDSNITVSIRQMIVTPWKLRTLIIRSETCLDQQTEVLLEKWLGSLTRLRLLYLDVPSLSQALVRVSRLTHLRYLFLFSCDGYHLQKAFKLYHLQVFKLNCLTGKEAGFHGIYNLCYLRCLHVPDNMLSNIHHVGRLTSLQELHSFDVRENDGHRLIALSNLTSLEKLSLKNLQNVRNFEEAMEIKLKEKLYIRFLSLSWNKYHNDPENVSSRVLDSLEPNKEIQHLHINGYNGVLLPQWIEKSLPIHLVSLDLEYCMKWKTLPSLQDLISLKYLKLDHLFQLEYIGAEDHFGTSESEDALLPPFLNTLIVRSCPSLKNLPAIPCTLEQLIIKHVGLEVLPRMHERYTGSLTFNWESASASSVKSDLAFLHIESCAHLTTLDEGFLKHQEHLQSLTTLIIRHCQTLCHLPKKGFMELHRLNILEIVACPILRDAKTEGCVLPVSLTNMDVNPCGDIEASVLMSLQNLTLLQRLSLFSCSNLERLPSENVFGTLNNLYDVSIARCENLLSLGGLGIVASLRVLSILCCDKLHFSYSQQAGCSFKLLKLEIDRQALLLVEPIKSLRHTKELQICDDNAMESLPGEWLLQNATSLHSIEIGVAESLCSLPSQMINLESLQSLHIERAPLIQSLPEMPMSLRKLSIWGCDRMFLKRYEKYVGLDWGRIAHIVDVDMKAYSEGMNCSGEQTQDVNNSTSNPFRQFVIID